MEQYGCVLLKGGKSSRMVQIVKFCGSNFLIRCIVDILHIRRKLFLILINDIFTGVPDLMYHTDLSG